jgi:hypothetical protein
LANAHTGIQTVLSVLVAGNLKKKFRCSINNLFIKLEEIKKNCRRIFVDILAILSVACDQSFL